MSQFRVFWRLSVGSALLVIFLAIALVAAAYFFPGPPSQIKIAGSFRGSYYNVVTARYKDILERQSLEVETLLTAGAADNLRLLMDPTSGVQVALMQGGVSDAKRSPGLRSLGRINYQIFWLFYHSTVPLHDVAELKGKRIAIGGFGSATRLVAEKILGTAGVTSATASLLPLAGQDAVDALEDLAVDAIFVAFAPEAPVIQDFLRRPNIRLLDFSNAEALTRIFPFLVQLKFPMGLFDYEKKIPATNMTVIATTNAVLVRTDVHPTIIDLLVQTMQEAHSDLGLFQRANEFPTQSDPEYPMAREALDYYKNGPSFLNRYLPFWATKHILKVASVALVMLALIPILRHSQALYRWTLRQMFLKFYHRLRAIEATMETGLSLSNVASLQTELKAIERAALGIKVPMRHSDLFYSLDSHIKLTRERLERRQKELASAQRDAAT